MDFPITDRIIVGQSGQTTLNNNIVLATAGAGSQEKRGFRTVAIQISPTGTTSSGAVTFEGSNDGTNWVAVPLYDEASLTANPNTAYTVATGVHRFFHGPVLWQYFRARISTVIGGGGTLQAFTTLSPVPFAPDIFTVTQSAAGNLNATVAISGTPSFNLGTGGTAATSLGKAEDAVHTSGDTGVAGLAVRSDVPADTTSGTGDYANVKTDSIGRVWVNGNYAVSTDQGYLHVRSTALGTTSFAIKGSAGNLYAINILNTNTHPVYVKVYNLVTATAGSGTPLKVYYCPPGDNTVPGSFTITPDDVALVYASTGLSAVAVQGLADNNAVGPTVGIYFEATYK